MIVNSNDKYNDKFFGWDRTFRDAQNELRATEKTTRLEQSIKIIRKKIQDREPRLGDSAAA
jgi:hypothetical protein